MSLSNERIQEMKDLMEKEKGTGVSWEDASGAADNLARFAELMLDFVVEDDKRKK